MKKYKRLTLIERYHIYALIKAEKTNSEIAKELRRDKRTIDREIARCNGPGNYDPEKAEKAACLKKRKSHIKAKLTDEMVDIIVEKLKEKWSPKQIIGWSKVNGIEMVSHQVIYDFVALDAAKGGTLYKNLRHGHKKAKKHGSNEKRGQIKNRVSIEYRPDEANNKVRIGDLEGDTIIGKDHKGVMITINDRKSKLVLIDKASSKNSKIVADTIIRMLSPLKGSIYTLTLDNGKEFAEHERIAKTLGIKVYFAHPYSSWERGLNENSNGLIRQFWPKKTSFETVTEQEIQDVIFKLNTRPRASLGFACPAAAFDAELIR